MNLSDLLAPKLYLNHIKTILMFLLGILIGRTASNIILLFIIIAGIISLGYYLYKLGRWLYNNIQMFKDIREWLEFVNKP